MKMPPNVIGLAGRKRVGKDSFFEAVLASGESVRRTAFADAIKGDMQNLPLMADPDVPKEVKRPLLQEYGEACKEHWGDDYWLTRLQIAYAYHLPYVRTVIITDVRFQNEADWIRSIGGKIVKIEREVGGATDSHVSETSVDDIVADYYILNEKSLSDYKDRAIELFKIAVAGMDLAKETQAK